ncbi:MAG: hypothetical protein BAJALOKI3v1_570009 [Promethearchaeota archaeon]|jgi:hypothetical protein|nr:MAG: hypothetical protein BAJALOKI3v1_570009 [Candidatus Lokiarchaeota archaeon]
MSANTLEGLIKKLQKNAIKLKGKHSPISERVKNEPKQLDVKNIHQLTNYSRDLYLIEAKNYDKLPKYRYFLVKMLANVSSDFLVELAKEFALEYDLKLLQYSVYPKTLRVSLLSLKELHKTEHYETYVKIFKDFNNIFQKKLEQFSNNFKNK